MPAPILWYNLSVDDVLKRLQSTAIGLRQSDIDARHTTYGYNELPEKNRVTAWMIFWRQWNSVLMYILCAAALIAGLLGEWSDAAIIMIAVLFNVILGFVQEYRAESGLASLRAMVTHEAKVFRNGLLRQVDARDLVPGDVVVLESGDHVPADMRLMSVINLAAAEAVLTGESDAVSKTVDLVASPKPRLVADRTNMVFKSTVIVEGKGTGVVVGTGMNTEIGTIAELLHKTEKEETPLQEKISRFSRMLGVVIGGLAMLIVLIGLWKGVPFWNIFLIAVAAAVAAVPEGLAVAVTVILAIGMQRILQKKALVRRLTAAETLGSTTVVCVDKTGTITEGVMRVSKLSTLSDTLIFDHNVVDPGVFTALIEATLLCNNAVVESHEGVVSRVIGSPTEKAILDATLALEGRFVKSGFTRVREIPFTSHTKIMFTLNRMDHVYRWFLKGAPEVVLSHCIAYEERGELHPLTEGVRAEWLQRIDAFTADGFRVLAAARQDASGADDDPTAQRKGILLGLWVLEDPVRPDVAPVVSLALNAGVRTIMITGDHVSTAKHIAHEIGLPVSDEATITGEELSTTPPDMLIKRLKTIAVCARVSPADKLKIVDALQANGEVVAMTGDGVNDAPALKAADIGIAVGSGTDVTKETADVVLLDNNFKTIIGAIEQGRIIFANIKKVIVYLLADSFTEIVLVVGSLLLGLPLPVTAGQILWINLITDGFPAMALTLEKAEPGVMAERPVTRTMPLLDREMKILIFLIGLFSDGLLLGMYAWLSYHAVDPFYIRSIIFAGLGMNSLLYVFSCRSLHLPLWKTGIRGNRLLVLAVGGGILLQLIPLYVPFMSTLLHVGPLDLAGWIAVLGVCLTQVVLIEITKYIFNRRKIV